MKTETGTSSTVPSKGLKTCADFILFVEAVCCLMWLAGFRFFEWPALGLALFCIPALLFRAGPLLWHWVLAKARSPRDLRPGDLYLGTERPWPHPRVVLPSAEREGHVAILGRTGCGKSTLMRLMAQQDIALGRRFVLVDPHVSLAEETAHACLVNGRVPILLASYPERMNSLNLLQTGGSWTALDAARCAMEGIVQVYLPFQPEIPMRIRPVLECAAYMLAAAQEGYTFLEIPRFLLQRQFRDHLARKVMEEQGGRSLLESTVPMTSLYWLETLTRNQFHDQIQSTYTRVASLVSKPEIQHLLGCSRSTFTFEDVQAGVPLLIAIGESELDRAGHLLNGLVMTWLTKRLLENRPSVLHTSPVSLYVDELAEISPESFETLFRHARKRRVQMTVIVQAQTMLHPHVYETLMGNVASLVVFGLGGSVAEELAREVSRPMPAESRDGSGQHLMELSRQLFQMGSQIRDLPKHEFLLYRSSGAMPLVHCATGLEGWPDRREVACAVEHCLKLRGKPVEVIEREIRERNAKLDAQFGFLQEVHETLGIREVAPW